MSEQLSIFDTPPPRQHRDPPRARIEDPATSKLAAARAGPLAHVHFVKIREAFRLGGDGTIYELAARVGLTHVQVARRMPELLQRGDVFLTGETRLSPGGHPCRVWGAF